MKRGGIEEPIDFQSLRYASYISRWQHDALENQARSYYAEKGEEKFDLKEKYDEFCLSAGVDEALEPNQDQRIILVGSEVRDKLGSVAWWLREHNIDIKVIEVSFYSDGEDLFLYPQTIIPLPTPERFAIGKRPPTDRPWISGGEDWHLNKRCGREMRNKLIQLVSIIKENFETVEGPNWNQKLYVSFKEQDHIWLHVNTHKTALNLLFTVRRGAMNVRKVSNDLGVEVFNVESPLSEKLQMRSSVVIIPRGEFERVCLRVKRELDVTSERFVEFLKQCFNSFKRAMSS